MERDKKLTQTAMQYEFDKKEAAAKAVVTATRGGSPKRTIDRALRRVVSTRGKKNKMDNRRQITIWRPVLPVSFALASVGKSLLIFKPGWDFRRDAVSPSMAMRHVQLEPASIRAISRRISSTPISPPIRTRRIS